MCTKGVFQVFPIHFCKTAAAKWISVFSHTIQVICFNRQWNKCKVKSITAQTSTYTDKAIKQSTNNINTSISTVYSIPSLQDNRNTWS